MKSIARLFKIKSHPPTHCFVAHSNQILHKKTKQTKKAKSTKQKRNRAKANKQKNKNGKRVISYISIKELSCKNSFSQNVQS